MAAHLWYQEKARFLQLMVGWNNPLPIGQALKIAFGQLEWCLGDGGKRYNQLPGQCGVIAQKLWVRGPPIHRVPYPKFLPPRVHHASYTSRSLVLYTSHFLPATHRPTHTTSMRPHCHQGSIGGNDLLRQGQRLPRQYPRQRN